MIGTDATAPYSVQWSSVNAGAYAITAIATDNSGSSTSSSAANVSVNLANNLPVISMTAPVGGLTIPAGQSLSLSANATDIDGSITKVDFYAGASLLGTDTTAPYSVTWTAIAGAQTLTAVATDNAGATATSAPVSISVVWQTGVTAVFDAYVKDGSSASTNFGTATELQTQQATGSNRESYLRFDLTNVNAVAKAKLRVYGKLSDASGSNMPVGVYSVATTNWIESGSGSITWNNKPATGGTALSTTTVTDTVSRWYEFDVTAWVQPERDAGHTLVSFALKSLAASEDKMDEPLQEYRTHLVDARQKAFEDFDKTLIALSGGALGLSFAFIKDLVGPGPLSSTSFLFTAWTCWGTSVGMVLVSYFCSQLTLNRAIAEIDVGQRHHRPGGIFRWLTTSLNALGGLLFLVGLILLVIFVSHNLEALNVSK